MNDNKEKIMNELVVKDNRLNLFTVFNTALQLKLFSKILVMLRKTPEGNCFVINISDTLNQFGIDKNNYTQIKCVAKSMEGYYEVPDHLLEDNVNSHRIAIFDEIKIDKENEVIFYVNEKIKPFTIGLTKNFSSYQLKNVVQLKSKASLRLYEILNQWKAVVKKSFKLDDLKLMIGVDKNQYKLYSNFKNRFLLKAQKELEEKTDIIFDFEEKKSGRRVSELIFYINNKSKLKKSSIFNNQAEEIIEADFEEESIKNTYNKIITTNKKEVVSEKKLNKKRYLFDISSVQKLISIGISEPSIEKEFNLLLLKFSKEDVKILFDNFLGQQEIKDILSGKKDTKSKSSYIFTLIKNRTFLNQETLEKILDQKIVKDIKKQEKEDLVEKYKIRNDDVFWKITKNLLEVEKMKNQFPTFLKLENINFSFINQDSNTAYLLISKSAENPKLQINIFLKEKEKIIEVMKKADNSVKDIEIAIDGEYIFSRSDIKKTDSKKNTKKEMLEIKQTINNIFKK